MALQQLGSARKVSGGTDQCLLPKTQESLPLSSDYLDLGVQDLLHSQPLDAVTLPNRDSLDYLRSSGKALSHLSHRSHTVVNHVTWRFSLLSMLETRVCNSPL